MTLIVRDKKKTEQKMTHDDGHQMNDKVVMNNDDNEVEVEVEGEVEESLIEEVDVDTYKMDK